MMAVITFFPMIMVVLNVCAAGAYALGGDWRQCIYWLAAATCTVCITKVDGGEEHADFAAPRRPRSAPLNRGHGARHHGRLVRATALRKPELVRSSAD
jgi:hypothetical protein